jgi:DNA recombination protein RmuC
MPMDSIVPWAIALIAIVVLFVFWILSIGATRRHRSEAEDLRNRNRTLEEANDGLRDAAARLPDAIDRASRAEAESESRLQRLSEASSANAAMQASERALRQSIESLQTSIASERKQVSELRVALEQVRERLSSTEANLSATHSLLVEVREESGRLKAVKESLSADLLQTLQKAAQAEAERDAAQALQSRTQQFLIEAQSALRTSFTEAASKVFDEKSLSLERKIADSAEASKTGLQTTLQPFAESIVQFRQRLETITSENTKDRSELSGKIDVLANLNQNMAAAADSLTKALKGNAKARGNWGEMVLESVLAASGLSEGMNYVRQPPGRDQDTGELQRPDVVVILPDSRKVIVDSKVNLVAWTDAVNADDQTVMNIALQKHVAAMRNHVSNLAEKNYPALYPGEALDITIAFVPIEAALSKALEISPDLQREAFVKGVAFATPNTLMAMMQVVERLWVRDKLQRQIKIIGDEAGKLLDSVSSFLSDFDAIEQSFDRADKQIKQARSRLETSPQSVLARAKRLVGAGARGKRKLHASLSTAADEQDALPLLDDGSNDIAAGESFEDESNGQEPR